jgi:hypothetical protein
MISAQTEVLMSARFTSHIHKTTEDQDDAEVRSLHFMKLWSHMLLIQAAGRQAQQQEPEPPQDLWKP